MKYKVGDKLYFENGVTGVVKCIYKNNRIEVAKNTGHFKFYTETELEIICSKEEDFEEDFIGEKEFKKLWIACRFKPFWKD